MAIEMAACNRIIGYLDDLLEPTAYDDYGPTGLQVPGSEQIQTVVTGVSANAELFTRAREAGADLVLVHHGLSWAGPRRPLDRASKRRLQLLFDADLALAAYHLPLEGHLEVSNNALLARAIGGEEVEPFAAHRRATIGVRARFAGAASPPTSSSRACTRPRGASRWPSPTDRTRCARSASPQGPGPTISRMPSLLDDRLAERFGVRHVFVDVPNPI
jgi:putative NIF3 family GTP cyclohydrolase 1 type 2